MPSVICRPQRKVSESGGNCFPEDVIDLSIAGNRINDIIETARDAALRSEIFFQHGAVLTRGSKIYGIGHNAFRPVRWAWLTLPPSQEITELNLHWRNCHAEVACIHNVKKEYISGSDIFVVRVTPGKNLANSKPCIYCMELLKKCGIRKVYYSKNALQLGVTRI